MVWCSYCSKEIRSRGTKNTDSLDRHLSYCEAYQRHQRQHVPTLSTLPNSTTNDELPHHAGTAFDHSTKSTTHQQQDPSTPQEYPTEFHEFPDADKDPFPSPEVGPCHSKCIIQQSKGHVSRQRENNPFDDDNLSLLSDAFMDDSDDQQEIRPAKVPRYSATARDSMLTKGIPQTFLTNLPHSMHNTDAGKSLSISDSLVVQSGIPHDETISHHGSQDQIRSNLSTANEQKTNLTPAVYYPVDHPDYHHTFTAEDACALEINEVLDKAGVPRGLYDELLSILKKHTNPKTDSDPVKLYDLPKREKFMNSLKERFPSAEPVIVRVPLETHFPKEKDISRRRRLRDVKEVITFDFWTQLRDLLSDMTIMGDRNNLVINQGKDQRWNPYRPPDGTTCNLDEVLDGKWYQDTINIPFESKPGHIFWIPILLYVDKTGTDAFQ